jgi:hypothetical protein
MDIEVIVERQADVPEIVETLRAATRFPRRLNRRQQDGDEHADDGNDNQQLYQSEAAANVARPDHEKLPVPENG